MERGQHYNVVQNEDSPSNGKIDNGNVGVGGFVTDRNGHGGADVADATTKGLSAVRGVSRHPNHIVGILGAFAQGRRETVGSFAAAISIVDVDQILADAVFQGSRAEVRICQLMSVGAGPKPHLGNVETHDVA